MDDTYSLKKLILQKLVRANVWGGKHTPVDFIIKGMPEHYRNTHPGKKTIEKTIKELVNHGRVIVTLKRTGKSSDQHLSLNPRKTNDIKQFLEEG
ncbi:MAG TPA: hypothetical protein VJG90_05230 [Candidatus Nanoarchaeia archaeon]|nr:hypothetical protein [Candidatus Nanoarchaeia archaeon]